MCARACVRGCVCARSPTSHTLLSVHVYTAGRAQAIPKLASQVQQFEAKCWLYLLKALVPHGEVLLMARLRDPVAQNTGFLMDSLSAQLRKRELKEWRSTHRSVVNKGRSAHRAYLHSLAKDRQHPTLMHAGRLRLRAMQREHAKLEAAQRGEEPATQDRDVDDGTVNGYVEGLNETQRVELLAWVFDTHAAKSVAQGCNDEKSRATARRKRSRAAGGGGTTQRRTRTKRTSCKHCNSTSHFMITSSQCPYNPKNVAARAEKGEAMSASVTD